MHDIAYGPKAAVVGLRAARRAFYAVGCSDLLLNGHSG